ncbi:hypothetical protein VTK56DRAFT_9695 [Thermocarpiscus australiensis]
MKASGVGELAGRLFAIVVVGDDDRFDGRLAVGIAVGVEHGNGLEPSREARKTRLSRGKRFVSDRKELAPCAEAEKPCKDPSKASERNYELEEPVNYEKGKPVSHFFPPRPVEPSLRSWILPTATSTTHAHTPSSGDALVESAALKRITTTRRAAAWKARLDLYGLEKRLGAWHERRIRLALVRSPRNSTAPSEYKEVLAKAGRNLSAENRIDQWRIAYNEAKHLGVNDNSVSVVGVDEGVERRQKQPGWKRQ